LTAAHHEYEKGLITARFFQDNNRAMGQDMVQDTFVKNMGLSAKGGRSM